MNTILESRAVATAESFRELDIYSPTRKMIEDLMKHGKIDVSQPFQKDYMRAG